MNWQAIQAVVEVLALGFTGIYVFVTYRTFREIKRQTDLQTEALLSIGARIEPPDGPLPHLGDGNLVNAITIAWSLSHWSPAQHSDRPPETFDPKIVDAHAKWRNVVSQQHPPVPQTERIVRLGMRNRGRSDVIHWRLYIRADVEPGPHLSHLPVKRESYEWVIESKGEAQIVEAGGKAVEVSIAPTGSFPAVRFSWSLEYTDVRGVKYLRFVGDREIVDANPFAALAPTQAQSGTLP